MTKYEEQLERQNEELRKELAECQEYIEKTEAIEWINVEDDLPDNHNYQMKKYKPSSSHFEVLVYDISLEKVKMAFFNRSTKKWCRRDNFGLFADVCDQEDILYWAWKPTPPGDCKRD